MCILWWIIFFFKQKTAYEMRISDWSSDVCSSDLGSRENVDKIHAKALALGGKDEGAPGVRGGNFYGGYFRDLDGNKLVAFHMEIGRASCRERVCQSV